MSKAADMSNRTRIIPYRRSAPRGCRSYIKIIKSSQMLFRNNNKNNLYMSKQNKNAGHMTHNDDMFLINGWQFSRSSRCE